MCLQLETKLKKTKQNRKNMWPCFRNNIYPTLFKLFFSVLANISDSIVYYQ